MLSRLWRRAFARAAGSVAPAVALAAALVTGGCIHTAHHAAVEPGWSGSVLAGIKDESLEAPAELEGWEHDDTETGTTVAQLDVSYGKRFSDHRAFRAALVVPLVAHGGSSFGGIPGTALDLYVQFLGGSLDAGAGVLGGLGMQGGYLEIGKSIHSGGTARARASLGVSREIYLLRDPAWRVFALSGWRFGKFELGLFAERLVADEVIKRCDEECYSNDYLGSSWTFGLMLGRKFR